MAKSCCSNFLTNTPWTDCTNVCIAAANPGFTGIGADESIWIYLGGDVCDSASWQLASTAVLAAVERPFQIIGDPVEATNTTSVPNAANIFHEGIVVLGDIAPSTDAEFTVFGTVAFGDNDHSPSLAANASILSGTENEVSGINAATIGARNIASGVSSFVAGEDNTADGDYSAIIAGNDNTATGESSIILGGVSNEITNAGDQSAILAGSTNIISNSSAVASGDNNAASGQRSAILGGHFHTASGANSGILGGNTNDVTGISDAIIGGTDNQVNGNYSAIISGQNNIANGTETIVSGVGNVVNSLASGHAILGGITNIVALGTGNYAGIFASDSSTISTTGVANAVVAGQGHVIDGTGNNNSIIAGNGGLIDTAASNSFIGGGENVIISANRNAAIGGSDNEITGDDSAIIGGSSNTIAGEQNAIISGLGNTITADALNSAIIAATDSTIASGTSIVTGYQNEILAVLGAGVGGASAIIGGHNNSIPVGTGESAVIIGSHDSIISATGTHNLILGGAANTITGTGVTLAIASGAEADVLHSGSWVHGTATPFASVVANEVAFNAQGGFRFLNDTGLVAGFSSPPGTVGIIATSSELIKEGFVDVDITGMASRFSDLRLNKYKVKKQKFEDTALNKIEDVEKKAKAKDEYDAIVYQEQYGIIAESFNEIFGDLFDVKTYAGYQALSVFDVLGVLAAGIKDLSAQVESLKKNK